MSIKDRLINAFLGDRIQAAAEQRIPAMLPALVEAEVVKRLPAASAGVEVDTQWRRLSGNSMRELPIAEWARQVEVCYWLWKLNPLGNWLIETLTYFVTGQGFTYTADDPDVKALIDSFWKDPINNLDLKLEDKVRELSIFGVQCWPVFKGEQTGRIRLGMVDPAQIQQIYTDPQNAELQIGVKIANIHTGTIRLLKTILEEESDSVMSEDARQLRETFTDGECFLFSINRVSNDPWGTSDIFVLADWLDEYEDFIYNYNLKARKQNAYIWDVKVDGASDEECQAIANKYPTQGDGALRVHNEKVTWTAEAPNLQAIEIKEAASVFRNHILGNKNMPEQWYGGGGNVNRSTAAESNEPILAFIRSRQNRVKAMLKQIITYAIRSALDARYLTVPEEEAFKFDIQIPESTNKDLGKISQAVQQIVAAIVAGASQGWIDQLTATKLFAFVIEMIGFSIDADAMLENESGAQDYPGKGKSGPEIPKTPKSPAVASGSENGPGQPGID